MVWARVIISCQKSDFSQKHLNYFGVLDYTLIRFPTFPLFNLTLVITRLYTINGHKHQYLDFLAKIRICWLKLALSSSNRWMLSIFWIVIATQDTRQYLQDRQLNLFYTCPGRGKKMSTRVVHAHSFWYFSQSFLDWRVLCSAKNWHLNQLYLWSGQGYRWPCQIWVKMPTFVLLLVTTDTLFCEGNVSLCCLIII